MKNRLVLLLVLTIFTIGVFGSSVPENVNSILSIKDTVSYWIVLLYILCLLIVIPFVYIGYLKNYTISDKKMPYHFKGDYNAKHIIAYVAELETLFGKRFLKFKKSIEQFDMDSAGNLSKHAEVIDSIILCIKLNGRKRLTVFWDFSDTFLKVIILLLPIIGVAVVLISNIYYELVGLILSLVSMIFLLPIILIMFSYFLQFTQYINRKRGKTLPALSLAFFAMEALLNRNVARSFSNRTGDYFYYTTIHNYNNLVNAKSGFSDVYVRSSSSIYGNLEEQSLGEE
jgi:hypothetical protein